MEYLSADRCLEDLENRIVPEVEDRLQSEWETFTEEQFEGDIFSPRRAKRSPAAIEWPSVTVNQSQLDLDAMVLQQYGACSSQLANGAGSMMTVRANYGTGIMPTLFGAELFVMDEELNTLQTSKPFGGDAMEGLLEKDIPDMRAGLGAAVLDAGKRFARLRALSLNQYAGKNRGGGAMSARWIVEQAVEWGEKQPWYFGANFYPSTAINQIEMWQAETFDPETIERELGYAQRIGMNIMRVYLHDLVWEQERDSFVDRINQYLSIADSKGIKTMFVIFDDCWHDNIAMGKQPDPKPYTHNSGWLQSPGHDIVEDSSQWPRLERYVKELMTEFKDDSRIALWDLYNEPGNGVSGDDSEDSRRRARTVPLLEATFKWARSVDGLTQPLTVAHWHKNEETNRCIAENSDIVTFHSYAAPDKGLNARIDEMTAFGRPAICSEYMARTNESTFEACLPVLRERCAGAINWGLVSGKSQTIYPWGWNESKGKPPLWFHDVFNPDGTLLYPEEEDVIRRVLDSPHCPPSCLA